LTCIIAGNDSIENTLLTLAKDRKAFVTGGGNGIGLGVVERLIDQGALVAAADTDTDRLAQLVARFGSDRTMPLHLDVSSADAVRAGIGDAAKAFGGLDTLVNSAGVFQFRRLADIAEREWDWIVDVNLKGTFLCCQAALPFLQQSGRGRIVNVASDAGKKGWPLLAHYSASKFGVVGLTQSLAVELGPLGITVNAVCPSSVPGTGMGQKVLKQKADLWNRSADAVLEGGAAEVPVGRLGTVADVADAIMFLLSENASFITGESLNVDGGQLSG
jgi:NAD(P)-dependent dehydrogenase (short-subunit alcohol dehydrogenase family)